MSDHLYVIVDPSRTLNHIACFWRPDSRGYTGDLALAGRYTEEEAAEITENCDDFAILEDVAECLAKRTVNIDDIRNPVVKKEGE